jgi:hypothetical protein
MNSQVAQRAAVLSYFAAFYYSLECPSTRVSIPRKPESEMLAGYLARPSAPSRGTTCVRFSYIVTITYEIRKKD